MKGRDPVALVLVLLSAAAAVEGKLWEVTDAKDGPGSCPGPTCNLRTAWGSARVNDTILLTVDPMMEHPPLTTPKSISAAPSSGYIRLEGRKAGGTGGAVIRSSDVRPFSLDNWPFGSGGVDVRLQIAHIEFIGTAKGYQSGVICIATGGDPTFPNLCSTPPPASHRLQNPTSGSKAGLLVGSNDTPWGNWSDFLANPVLHLERCTFRGNAFSGQSTIYGGLIQGFYLMHNSNSFPIVVKSCRFADNTYSGVSPAGSIIQASVIDVATSVPVLITDTEFTNNLQHSTPQPSAAPGVDGPIVCTNGPISIHGSSFVGNTIGATRAVISAPPAIASYHVDVRNTIISRNEANSLPTDPRANGTVLAGWMVLTGVTMSLPASVPNVASFSPNDQYFVNCALSSTVGHIQTNGYQIYNKDPVYLNITNELPKSIGFANCKEALPWVPCPTGTSCEEVHYMGQLSGVRCH